MDLGFLPTRFKMAKIWSILTAILTDPSDRFSTRESHAANDDDGVQDSMHTRYRGWLGTFPLEPVLGSLRALSESRAQPPARLRTPENLTLARIPAARGHAVRYPPPAGEGP